MVRPLSGANVVPTTLVSCVVASVTVGSTAPMTEEAVLCVVGSVTVSVSMGATVAPAAGVNCSAFSATVSSAGEAALSV